MNKLNIIIMASGFSKRMGFDKLNFKIGEKTLFEKTLETVLAFVEKNNGEKIKIIVVAKDENILKTAKQKGVCFAPNQNATVGQSESIKIGLGCGEAKNYMFVPSDQPFLDVETIQQIFNAIDSKSIIIPISIENNIGSPKVFPTQFKQQLLNLSGDVGGKTIVKNNEKQTKFVEITNKQALLDIDCVQDIKKVMNKNEAAN